MYMYMGRGEEGRGGEGRGEEGRGGEGRGGEGRRGEGRGGRGGRISLFCEEEEGQMSREERGEMHVHSECKGRKWRRERV